MQIFNVILLYYQLCSLIILFFYLANRAQFSTVHRS